MSSLELWFRLRLADPIRWPTCSSAAPLKNEVIEACAQGGHRGQPVGLPVDRHRHKSTLCPTLRHWVICKLLNHTVLLRLLVVECAF
mmetsp:Transcript_50644/g.163852  ORF Transcript_50644/g.163852 Transcript_50644/m.163852 type:complete len:87 (+) Transcript_50644:166-426(+)